MGEVSVRVEHCLLAAPGTRLAEVTRVASHPQALAQCDAYIRSLGPGVAREPADDTAGSARALARDPRPGVAVIASAKAGELYGLETLAAGIQDSNDNVTRFLVLSRDPAPQAASDPRPHKTALVFALPDRPGALFTALSVFALRGIDMSKIESRPAKGGQRDGSEARGGWAMAGGASRPGPCRHQPNPPHPTPSSQPPRSLPTRPLAWDAASATFFTPTSPPTRPSRTRKTQSGTWRRWPRSAGCWGATPRSRPRRCPRDQRGRAVEARRAAGRGDVDGHRADAQQDSCDDGQGPK